MRWHCNTEGFVCFVPVSLHLTAVRAVCSSELNLLASSVVETSARDHDVCATSGRANVRNHMLHVDIIVAEVHGLASVLLTIECHIN